MAYMLTVIIITCLLPACLGSQRGHAEGGSLAGVGQGPAGTVLPSAQL